MTDGPNGNQNAAGRHRRGQAQAGGSAQAGRPQPQAADRQAQAGRGRPDLSGLARGGTLNLFGLVVSGLMQVVLTVVVARGLGPGRTGAFFEGVALFTILSNIGELGADTGLVRMFPKYLSEGRNSQLRTLAQVAMAPPFVFCLGLAAITWLYAPALASLLAHGQHQHAVETFLRTLAPFIPLGAVSTVALAGTRGMGTMVPFVWIQNLLVPVLRPVVVAVVVALGLGPMAVALGWATPLALAMALGGVILWGLVRVVGRMGPRSGPVMDRGAITAEFWRFSGPRALAAVFGVMISWLDVLLVGILAHPAADATRQAGIYAAASRLSVMGALALNALGMVIAPQVSAFASARRMREAESIFQVGTWWLMAITWPAYISIGVFAPLLLGVFGHGFVAGQTALVILCVAQLFNLGTGNVTVVLLMVGKSSWNLINSAVSLALNVGLNLLLIPRLGITGAAIAWAASIVCSNLAAVLEVHYLLRIRPFGSGYWVVATSSLICFGLTGVVIRAVAGVGLAQFALFAILSTGLYAAVLWQARRTLHLSSLLAAIPRRRPAPTGP
jgi:O-antigen/teichoic acid export membrane protein